MHSIALDPELGAALRRARGPMPRYIVAARSGVSPDTIARAERYGVVSVRTLAALARVYGVSIDDLRGRRTTGGAS